MTEPVVFVSVGVERRQHSAGSLENIRVRSGAGELERVAVDTIEEHPVRFDMKVTVFVPFA